MINITNFYNINLNITALCGRRPHLAGYCTGYYVCLLANISKYQGEN